MTTHYGLFNDKGEVRGFWNTDIYPPKEKGDIHDDIPKAAVEISEKDWQELLANPAARYIKGKIVYVELPKPPPPPPNPMDELKEQFAELKALVMKSMKSTPTIAKKGKGRK